MSNASNKTQKTGGWYMWGLGHLCQSLCDLFIGSLRHSQLSYRQAQHCNGECLQRQKDRQTQKEPVETAQLLMTQPKQSQVCCIILVRSSH